MLPFVSKAIPLGAKLQNSAGTQLEEGYEST
jgi:hypothetical protein